MQTLSLHVDVHYARQSTRHATPRPCASVKETCHKESCVAGLVRDETAASLHQAGMSRAEAKAEAWRLSTQVVRSTYSVVSPGDVVCQSQRYISHRASCHNGMSGSPVRLKERPQLFVGIHLGSSKPGTDLDAGK